MPCRFALFASYVSPFAFMQGRKAAQPSASDLYQSIKKTQCAGLRALCSLYLVMMKTQRLSAIWPMKLYDITYLSLTRGDGGQNLIGTEQRELLGVLRTQELLMARSVDWANNYLHEPMILDFQKAPKKPWLSGTKRPCWQMWSGPLEIPSRMW